MKNFEFFSSPKLLFLGSFMYKKMRDINKSFFKKEITRINYNHFAIEFLWYNKCLLIIILMTF